MFNLLLLHLAAWAIPISAQIYMGFPFNEQLPNVGRINEPYSFTIASTTYKSNTDAYINYEVTGLPAWLSFDPGSRTFSGQPTQENVGTFEITLIGTDTHDSTTLSNTYQMMVSQDPGIKLSSPDAAAQEIAKFGPTNGGNGLVVKEGENVNLRFDKSIFVAEPNSQNGIVAYYGRSADRSSLPNWLQFNSEDASFSGTVPHVTSQNAPSFEYGFSFIASDYSGFAGAVVNFKLVVGGHQLSTSVSDPIKINGTLNGDINVNIENDVLKSVYLDGNLITNDQVYRVSTTGDLPSYLTFDENSRTFTGKFPDHAVSDKVTVQVNDIYQNQVQVPLLFVVSNDVFSVKEFPNVNATKGQFFDYSIGKYIPDSSAQISVNFDSNGWLSYDAGNKTFIGMTPKDFDSMKISVIGELNGNSETLGFSIMGVNKEVKTTSTSSSSTKTSTSSSSKATSSSQTTSATTTTTPTTTPTESDESETSGAPVSPMHKHSLAIGLGVGLGILALIASSIIFFCCCFKRRDINEDSDLESGSGAAGSSGKVQRTISPPQDVKSTMNLTKFDQVKHDSETKSTSSSITHVNDGDSVNSHFEPQQHYMDVTGVGAATAAGIAGASAGTIVDVGEDLGGAVKSWRALGDSDLKRISEASLSTVNTEQLFSVRLVEDQSNRNSVTSSRYLGNSPPVTKSNVGGSNNIQRLDSDGNIVETYRDDDSRPSSHLYNVTEENTHDITQSSGYEEDDNNSLDLFKHDNQSSQASESDQEEVVKYPWGFESTGGNIGAKLVDFTRRGSLKDSARDQSHQHFGVTAQIHENDSD
ncbi:Axial budding pattern protein 2 [Spathaspora sp. JA1]|nr:Axial budding pattern protein 2 [Spathaspora sp. JA1]